MTFLFFQLKVFLLSEPNMSSPLSAPWQKKEGVSTPSSNLELQVNCSLGASTYKNPKKLQNPGAVLSFSLPQTVMVSELKDKFYNNMFSVTLFFIHICTYSATDKQTLFCANSQ